VPLHGLRHQDAQPRQQHDDQRQLKQRAAGQQDAEDEGQVAADRQHRFQVRAAEREQEAQEQRQAHRVREPHAQRKQRAAAPDERQRREALPPRQPGPHEPPDLMQHHRNRQGDAARHRDMQVRAERFGGAEERQPWRQRAGRALQPRQDLIGERPADARAERDGAQADAEAPAQFFEMLDDRALRVGLTAVDQAWGLASAG